MDWRDFTKTDGDARGGAALSVRAITGKPIKFLGRGENPDAQTFHPERGTAYFGHGWRVVTGRKVEQKLTVKKENEAKKQKGGAFDLGFINQFNKWRI